MKLDINSVAAVLCTIGCIVNFLRDNFLATIILVILASINYYIAINSAYKDKN